MMRINRASVCLCRRSKTSFLDDIEYFVALRVSVIEYD